MEDTAHHTKLLGMLDDQMAHLDASLTGFVQGRFAEANRVAVVVRVLVHDTALSRSLYSQLELKSVLKWVSTEHPPPSTGVIMLMGLFSIRLAASDGESTMEIGPVPPDEILARGTLLDFDTWWTTPVLISNSEVIARRDIVSMLANQDGGAHVDITKARFVRLLASVPAFTFASDDDPQAPREVSEEVARATLRAAMVTIASEVQLGFWNQLDTIDPDGILPRPTTPETASGATSTTGAEG